MFGNLQVADADKNFYVSIGKLDAEGLIWHVRAT